MSPQLWQIVTAVITVAAVLTLLFGIEARAERRVRRENERREREYQHAVEQARRDRTRPPVPPNLVVRR